MIENLFYNSANYLIKKPNWVVHIYTLLTNNIGEWNWGLVFSSHKFIDLNILVSVECGRLVLLINIYREKREIWILHLEHAAMSLHSTSDERYQFFFSDREINKQICRQANLVFVTNCSSNGVCTRFSPKGTREGGHIHIFGRGFQRGLLKKSYLPPTSHIS